MGKEWTLIDADVTWRIGYKTIASLSLRHTYQRKKKKRLIALSRLLVFKQRNFRKIVTVDSFLGTVVESNAL